MLIKSMNKNKAEKDSVVAEICSQFFKVWSDKVH